MQNKHAKSARLGKIARAAATTVARFFLIALATAAYGLALGAACNAGDNRAQPVAVNDDHLDVPNALPVSASVDGSSTAEQSSADTRPTSTLTLPPGEELFIAPDDVLAVVIPSRRARWGRPLCAANIGHQIVFTARFASFPEYKADDTPRSLRVYDFTDATWGTP